jgi:hypothetical protein
MNCPTACVTCGGAGMDNAWEQRKPEARKMLENAAEPRTCPVHAVLGAVLINSQLRFYQRNKIIPITLIAEHVFCKDVEVVFSLIEQKKVI